MGEEKEILVSGLEFAYPGEEPGMPGHIVLKGLDLQIPRGQFVAVLGHNGSGKSTLAKHFNAILLPTSGDVIVCGINTKDEDGCLISASRSEWFSRILITRLLQRLLKRTLPLHWRIWESNRRKSAAEWMKHSKKSICTNIVSTRPTSFPVVRNSVSQLPEFWQWRPDFIVLDEPTAMLDPRGRSEVLRTIRELTGIITQRSC